METSVEPRPAPVETGLGDFLSEAKAAAKKTAEEERAAKAEAEKYWLARSRGGGTYIPPRRAAMLAQEQELPEAGSEAYQKLTWEALRKSLNGLINKINTSNIKEIIVELFGENLERGRGLLVKSVIKSQAAALPFTSVYAALVAVLNTKLPAIGELALTRLIHQFRRAYRRNDKAQCLACVMFLAHLVNQRVSHEIVGLQVLTLLLERPTDDSVEIAVGFMRECGAALAEISPRPTNAIFERFRVILHEGKIDKRVQYMVEVLFQLRKDNFAGHVAISPSLDLVAEEDQITHYVSLDDELEPQEALNIFKVDPDYAENEEHYAAIRDEILGEEDSEAEADEEKAEAAPADTQTVIKDQTSTDLINLRKTIYLTIMSSVDFEECGHKLLKLNVPEGMEVELCNMIVECCSQERTYLKYFGLLAERFCALDPAWQETFEQCFQDTYQTVHRLETNRIRNISKLFGHLFYTDSLRWAALGCIALTEEETTSASRIFVKFLFHELMELFGIPKLKAKLEDRAMVESGYFNGLFPKGPSRDLRFSINFFTAIGLGALTEEMRVQLDALMAQEDTTGYGQMVEGHHGAPPQWPPPGQHSPADSYATTASRSPSRSPQRGSHGRDRHDGQSEYERHHQAHHRRGRSRSPPRRSYRSPSRDRSPQHRHAYHHSPQHRHAYHHRDDPQDHRYRDDYRPQRPRSPPRHGRRHSPLPRDRYQ